MARVAHQEQMSVRIGNPWLAIPYFVFVVGCTGVGAAFSIAFIVSGKPDDPGIRFGTLLATIPAGAGLTGLVFFAVVTAARNPRLLSRTVVLTPGTILIPLHRHARIPISTITGVGLALQQRVPGRGGARGIMIWSTDSAPVWTGGIQRSAQLDTPETTRMGLAAKRIYSYVAQHQGTAGPLIAQARQRHPQWSAFSPYKRAWDPSGPDSAASST